MAGLEPIRTAGPRVQPLSWLLGMLAEGDKTPPRE